MSLSANTLSPDIQASDVVFALVRVDKELWKGWVLFQKNQRVRRWKPPQTFEWQYNNRTYSCEPGKTAQVPLVAARHGVKTSGVFRLNTDVAGNELKSLDHEGGQEPLLEIVRTMTAGEPGAEMAPLPASAVIRCPFCKNVELDDQEGLKKHLIEKHQVVDAQSKAQKAMDEATARPAA